MRALQYYKDLIESELDILNCLVIRDGKMIANSEILATNKIIESLSLDDLFSWYRGKLIFSNRFLSLVSEITDRQVLCSHYFLELRV